MPKGITYSYSARLIVFPVLAFLVASVVRVDFGRSVPRHGCFSLATARCAEEYNPATYFVDATGGKDSNPGTSESEAWLSLVNVNKKRFRGGDRILFKRGELWQGQLIIQWSGTAEHPIMYGNYGNGKRPVLTGLGDVSGWDVAGTWSQGGSSWFTFLKPNASHLYRLFVDGKEKQRAKSKNSMDKTYCWYWDKGLLYIYSQTNPAETFSSMEYSGATGNGTVCAYDTDYITIQGLDIRGATNAVFLSNCDHWVIENSCVGMYSGEMGIKVYPSKKGSSDYVTIRRCLIDSGKRFFNNWYNEDPCEGVILQHASYWKIHENLIKDWCHAGVGLSGAEGPVTKNEVYNNYITCEDVDYGRPLGCGGGGVNCADNKFYNNYIYNCGARLQIGGERTVFCYNIIDTIVNDRTPYFKDRAQGLMISTYESTICSNNIYCNNVIYNCDEAGIFVRAYGKGERYKIEGNLVANNIVMNCGRDSGSEQKGLALVVKGENIGNNTFKNNCIFNVGSGERTIFYRSQGVISVKAFNMASGKAPDAISSNIAGDPRFANPPKKDFTLLLGSPCRDTGITLDLPEAKNFFHVPPDIRTDIGAFETDVPSLGPRMLMKTAPAFGLGLEQ